MFCLSRNNSAVAGVWHTPPQAAQQPPPQAAAQQPPPQAAQQPPPQAAAAQQPGRIQYCSWNQCM